MAITKEVKVVISAVDQFSSQMGLFDSNAFKMFKSIEKVALALMAVSTAAAAVALKLGSEVFSSAADFHDAMYNVEAVAQSFGTTGGQISDILDDLTQKFPVTGQEAGAALQLIAQLGYGAEVQMRDMAEAANVLQIATGADLQTGVMGTLALLNSFNLESGEATRIINLLAAASFSSAANVEDLGIALRYAAPIASIMGISVEETVAAIATLRDRGLEASQAGTTLRMALVQLGKETKAKTEVLAKFGLTMADVNPEVVGLEGVIRAFNGQLISGSEAATLFGVRSTAFAHIVNLGADAFGNYTASITDTNAAYDAMEKKLITWDVVQRNVTGNIDLFKKSIAGGLIPEILHLIGTTENEGFRGVLNYMTQLEKEFGTLNEAFGSGLDSITGAIDSVFQESFGGELERVYEYIGLIALALAENLNIVTTWGAEFTNVLIKSSNDAGMLKLALTTINVAFAAIAVPIALVHDVISNAFAAWRLGIDFLVYSWQNMRLRIYEVGEAVLEVMNRLSFGSFDEELVHLREEMGLLSDSMEAPWEKDYFNMWTDDALIAFGRAQNGINEMGETADVTKDKILEIAEAMDMDSDDHTAMARFKLMEESTEKTARNTQDYVDALKRASEPQEKTTEAAVKLAERWVQLKNFASAGDLKLFDFDDVEVTEAAVHGLEAFQKRVDSSGESMRTSLDALNAYEKGMSNIAELKPGEEMLTELVKVNGEWKEMSVVIKKAAEETVNLDQAVGDMTDREFSLYTEKFKADLDLVKTKMQETHETVRKNIEWKAKVDIADAEAAAKVLVEAFKAAGQSVDATADASKSMFSDIADLLGGDKWLSSTTKGWLQKQLEDQMALQKAALEIQKALSEAEVRNLDARTEKIKNLNKEAMITVDGDGLKPHLEAMMWEVFEAIQVRATEEGLDKLLLGGTLSTP